jgi:hypothetical protein
VGASAEHNSRRAGTRLVLALSLLVPLAAGALVLAGLGGAAKPKAAAARVPPTCATGRAPRAADIARGFPLPRSTVIASVSRQHGARVVRGHVPGSLTAARDFFATSLPASGFVLGAGDAEAYEAETDFVGRSVRGHLRLNASFACPGTVDLAVVLR